MGALSFLGMSHGNVAIIVWGGARLCNGLQRAPRYMDTHFKAPFKAHFKACSELIECQKSDEIFLIHKVAGDETWVHRCEPESKRV